MKRRLEYEEAEEVDGIGSGKTIISVASGGRVGGGRARRSR